MQQTRQLPAKSCMYGADVRLREGLIGEMFSQPSIQSPECLIDTLVLMPDGAL
jgi:hypothetical protein